MNSKRGGSFFAFVFGLALGAVLGVVLTHKYLQDQAKRAASAAPSGQTAAPPVERNAPSTKPGESSDDAIDRKLREWNLDPDQIRRELSRAGDVIKREGRQIGGKIADATSDVRAVGAIKAKYALDKQLSAWSIIVACKEGHVTLAGTVKSPEQIGRAIVLALDTDGVIDVSSTLQVKP